MGARIKPGKNTDRILRDTIGHREAFRSGMTEAMNYVGQISLKRLRELIIQGPKTGRIYRRPGGRLHQASAPGQPPANDTGQLQRTATYDVSGTTQIEFGDTEPYGRWLEDGTKDGRILPRGHVKRAADEVSRQATAELGNRVARKLKIL